MKKKDAKPCKKNPIFLLLKSLQIYTIYIDLRLVIYSSRYLNGFDNKYVCKQMSRAMIRSLILCLEINKWHFMCNMQFGITVTEMFHGKHSDIVVHLK